MTTARERAREAVFQTYSRGAMLSRERNNRIADAASDVWEPIVHELLTLADDTWDDTGIIQRAREALDA